MHSVVIKRVANGALQVQFHVLRSVVVHTEGEL